MMNKYELLESLEDKYPLTDDNKYYILTNKYIYPSVVIRPEDIENTNTMFPEITNKLTTEALDIDFNAITICQSNGIGGATEHINLGELLSIEEDRTEFVEVSIKHVFDCVPKDTTSYKTFQCHPDNVDKEIDNHIMDMRIQFDLHYEEPGLILEKEITEVIA